MGFQQAVRRCFSLYVTFSGRAARPEYWWFVLFVVIGGIVAAIIDRLAFGVGAGVDDGRGPVRSIFGLAVFLPLLAAGWRRLHDTGRPGWYIIVPLLISFAALITLFGGVLGFALLEQQVADPQTLVGPAGLLGGAGMALAAVLQLIVMVLLLWWLTRPSQPGANEYGRSPR